MRVLAYVKIYVLTITIKIQLATHVLLVITLVWTVQILPQLHVLLVKHLLTGHLSQIMLLRLKLANVILDILTMGTRRAAYFVPT